MSRLPTGSASRARVALTDFATLPHCARCRVFECAVRHTEGEYNDGQEEEVAGRARPGGYHGGAGRQLCTCVLGSVSERPTCGIASRAEYETRAAHNIGARGGLRTGRS